MELYHAPDVVHNARLAEFLGVPIVIDCQQPNMVSADDDQVGEIFAGHALPSHVVLRGLESEAIDPLGLPIPDNAAVVDVEELAVTFGVLLHSV